ncbi:MAG: hypothetical protein QHC78_09740 [Pigmentiphaga sp.]|uniref:hypothetical protein n=1 Tax=Pigmentiphaga sp. TaxID=1977564 RepID=UPI0029AD0D8A|nr:hypothetical protein [Pigmentiphaga sp.]MDX3905955.1 hypothetical protein [Pigmentiphaga sp.]
MQADLDPAIPLNRTGIPTAAGCREWAALSGVALDGREAARIARAVAALAPGPARRIEDPQCFELLLERLARHD